MSLVQWIDLFVYCLCSIDGTVINVTQDPMEIYSRLIHNHTIQGELIMDCFAGSGTCSVAALLSGRDVIAIEPDHGQIEGIHSGAHQ